MTNCQRRFTGWRKIVPVIAGAVIVWAGVSHLPARRAIVRAYAQQMGNGYADPDACLRCHANIAASYRQTGMGQSFHRVTSGGHRAASAGHVEDFQLHNTLYNKASDRHYTMLERDGALFEQRFQTGFDGSVTNREEMRIDYVIGSGNHALTYLHRTSEGKLIELPVSWYSEAGGYWEMSPGYDDAHQQDFRRAIPYECMACHNGYPAPDPAANSSPDKNIFGANLPEGIDCQRCHGPGQAHVEAAEDGESTEAIRAAIVNPARLSRERQMDVCMQCHLETTSWPLPHSIRRFEHGAFSYRPGEPLENYQLAFDHKPAAGYDDEFQVAHQAYRLRKSACFRKSQMTCITCHDPHVQLRGQEAIAHYVSVCLSCHVGIHASRVPNDEKPAAQRPADAPNCLTCHMGKRRTDDAVHVVMTDHYIQRIRPKVDPMGDPLSPQKQSPGYYRGEVVPYYPQSLDKIPNGDLYLAIAQTEDDANLAEGAVRLRTAIDRVKPSEAEFYFAMGAAYSKLGRNEESIRWYQEAIRRRPDFQQAQRALAAAFEASGALPQSAEAGEKAASTAHPDTTVLTSLGRVYLSLGRTGDAKRVLRQALAIEPDLPDADLLLGMASMREGDTAGAEALYRKAIASQPDLADAHNDLAGILAHRGNYAEAAYELKKAIEANPTDAQIHRNYGALLANTGATIQAVAEMKEAVRLNPKSVRLHVDLGGVLAKNGEKNAAEDEYRAALALDAQDGAANLRLADLLARDGKVEEARSYYASAAKSADPKIRQAALDALQK